MADVSDSVAVPVMDGARPFWPMTLFVPAVDLSVRWLLGFAFELEAFG